MSDDATRVERTSDSREEPAGQSNPVGRIHSSPNYHLVAGLLVVSGAATALISWYVSFQRPFLPIVGAIGVFGGSLLYYLTRGRFVSGRIPDRVYAAMAENETAVLEAFDRSADPVYVPTANTVVLYVPRDPSNPNPSPGEIISVPNPAPNGNHGLTFVPTGEALFEDFEATLIGSIASDPATLSKQLEEGILETFELARATDLRLDPAAGRLDVSVEGSVFPAGFDSPVASFFAVGMARGLGTEIVTEISRRDDHGFDVTCLWDTEAVDDDR